MNEDLKYSPVVEIKELTKNYGSKAALSGIDVRIKKGTIFALLGPNGAGKSTTVKILEGLVKGDSGIVRVLGKDPWKDQNHLKAKIGVLPQEFNFFSDLTPAEGLKLYRSLFSSSVDLTKLLKLVLLDDSSRIKFSKLSGGQKQKLGLALSMINDPEVLFLDEPTVGLDPQARRSVWKIIKSFKENGKTVFLTTHYLEEAEQLADQVSIIDEGKVLANGPPEQIVNQFGTGRKIILKSGARMFDFLRKMDRKIVQEENFIEIPLSTEESLSELISEIERSGIPYQQLTVKSDSLEDVFLKMVGEPAGDDLN